MIINIKNLFCDIRKSFFGCIKKSSSWYQKIILFYIKWKIIIVFSDIKKSILYIIISDIRKPFSDNRIRIFDILISQNA